MSIARQLANRVLIGRGTYLLGTVPAGVLWQPKFAAIVNSNTDLLSGSVFMVDSTGVIADAMVTAINLGVLRTQAKLGQWDMLPGDMLLCVINGGTVASVHVAGLVRKYP